MTAPGKEQKVAECLNRLHCINLGGIASNNDIKSFIADYFIEEEDGDDNESILDESDEDYEGKVSRNKLNVNITATALNLTSS